MQRYDCAQGALRAMLVVLALTAAGTPVRAAEWIYTVVPGDNLWDLSEHYLHGVLYWQKVQALNGVENPRKLQPGARLRIPLQWIRVEPTSAQISEIQGEARLLRSGDPTPVAARAGTKLFLGDRLIVDAPNSVAVRFADASTLTLHGRTELVFDLLSAYGDTGMVDTRLRLKRGRVTNRVTPAEGPGSRYEIRTPAAVSAVRGTRFRLRSDEQGATRAEVIEGRVAVTGAGRRTLLAQGFGTRVETGNAPLPSRPLLSPPELTTVPERIERRGAVVAWASLSGAEQYRSELSASDTFNVLLTDQLSSAPHIVFPDLPDGRYHLRVRGVDNLGIEGRDAVKTVQLDARPEPPLPLLPAQGAVIRDQTAKLEWTASADADSYRLQVGVDRQFSSLHLDTAGLARTSFTVTDLPVPGRYYWRLASTAANGDQGPFGDVRMLETKPEPPTPEPSLQGEGDAQVVASWPAVEGVEYQVQLAKDPGFRDLVLDRTITEPRLPIERRPGQILRLRIRLVEPDGYAGPWSATQEIPPPADYSWLLIPAGALLFLAL